MTYPEDPVGMDLARVDGVAKVTGAARYVDDEPLGEAIFGKTVRSAVPHGRLRGIELDPAFDFAGVTVVTAADIDGRNVVALIEDDQPVLVAIGETVRHADQAVALVAAASKERAEAAARHVSLDIEPLPAVLTIEDALEASVCLHGDDNVIKRYEIHRGDDLEAAFARADVIIEGTYRTSAAEQMYIEPQGAIAHWDDQGRLRVLGSLQCPYYVHRALTQAFALADGDVIVTQAVTGGGFGGKEEYPSLVAIHAALLARVAKRPVRLVYDRREDIAATTKRHPARVGHRMGVMNDGTIVAVDVDVVLDCGAYVTLSPVVLSRAVLHAAGPYRIPAVRIVGRGVLTNLPPHGAFRGFGAPQTTFAYERQVQKAARRLGIDPLEMRRKNMLLPGDRTATGQLLEHSVGTTEVLDGLAAALASPPSRASESFRSDSDPTRAFRHGTGLAFYFHGAGFTGSGEARLKGQAAVAVLPDGRFEVRAASTDIGQGTATIFAQIAASALGVEPGEVIVATPSTDRVPDSGPTVASRTCMVVGKVVETAASGLRRRLLAHAEAHGLDSSSMVEIAKAYVAAGEDPVVTETYAPPPGIHWDDQTYSGDAYPTYGWAACHVELRIDEDTHEVVIDRCIHVVDVGHAIHPLLVRGQIEGGTLQALGWALLESVVYGADGRVANASMTDCIIPTSLDAPELETVIVEVPFPHGPHGAKGVGELPMDGPAAAVAGAIEAALGMSFDTLPVSPERIGEAVAAARGRDQEVVS